MRYIIDTDPGIDDTIAICLGYLNHLKIIGFTLASGNIEEEKAENNIKVIEDFLESNIPIYKSSITNECNHKTAEYAHGKDGLGYAVFPLVKHRKTEKTYAENFIIKSSKKYKDNLTMVCFGSLTNLANALKKDPGVAKRIKHLVIMGASYDSKAKELYHEFNIGVDPKSAKLVLEAPFEDIKIVTHEMGLKATIEKEYLDKLEYSDNRISRFINNIHKKYYEFGKKEYKLKDMAAPDPITISSIIDPNIVTYVPCKIKVSLKEKGTTEIELVDESNIKISTNIDLNRFRDLIIKTFK